MVQSYYKLSFYKFDHIQHISKILPYGNPQKLFLVLNYHFFHNTIPLLFQGI